MASIFRQKYTKKDKSGRTVRKQSKYWYIDYKAADGRRKRVKGFKDKQATAQLAAQLELEAEQAQVGMIDKYKEHRKRPLQAHMRDFKQSLLDKGDTKKHACLVYNRAKAVVDNCGFMCFSDISASKVQRYLAERRRSGLSIRSSNFYLQAVKQFLNWMVADNRNAENPLAYLKGQNPKTDIRHPRRALTIDELTKLLKTTIKGRKHHNMTGKERAMLYKLAANTGFRANELASLRWQSLNLSDSAPSVKVLAGYSKRRREDLLPLRLDITCELASWKSEQGTKEDAKLFPKFNPNKAADMLKKDLKRAGIEYVYAAGRYADFHSLRHCFASILNQSGVSPKVAQSLLRHSTIGLTMDTYTHIGLYDERAALNSLPELPSLGDESSENQAGTLKTGTDDLPAVTDESAYKPAYKKLTKNAFSGFDQSSLIDITQEEKQGLAEKGKSLVSETLGTGNNQLSTSDTEKKNRRRADSNRRITVLQTVALGLLATPPNYNHL